MWVLMQSCNSKMQYLRGPNHAHAALVEVHQYYPGRATLLPGLQHWEHCTPVRTQGHTGSTAHPVLFPRSDSLVKTCGRRCLCWLAGGLCHAALSQVARQVSPGTAPGTAQLSHRYCTRYCAALSPGTVSGTVQVSHQVLRNAHSVTGVRNLSVAKLVGRLLGMPAAAHAGSIKP